MNRAAFGLVAALAVFPATAGAQFTAPARPAPAPTSEKHLALIKEGVALHNKGDYDAALARYQAVLDENADDLLAWYETSVTLSMKKELPKALAAAMRGAEYSSERVGEFYNMIGNIYAQMKLPDTAIRAFEYGITLDPTEAQLHYNLSVSYAAARRAGDALKAVKTAVSLRPDYGSAHYNAAVLFLAGGYPVPALLAAGRYLTLDQQTQRAAAALSIFLSIMRENQQQSRGGGSPSPVPSGKTDEGTFTTVEAIIYAGRAPRTAAPVQETPEIRRLVEQMSAVIGALAAQAKSESTWSFAYQYYVPYFVQMHERNFVQPFVHFIFQRAGLPGTAEWLTANSRDVKAFLEWSATYQWARPAVP